MFSVRIFRQCHLLFILFIFAFLNINYASGQTAPEFQSTPITEATYGSVYNYEIVVFDAEGDDLAVIIQSGSLPTGVILIENAGEYSLEGIPTETGSFPIVLEVYETNTPANNDTQSFTIEVSKATLFVTADDQNIVYGDPIPSLSISYSGFVNSEDASDLTTVPLAGTTADGSSDAGDYPISVSGGISENYDFDYTAGTLSIAKADQTITFNAITDKVYGDADFALSASSDSGLPVSFSVASGNTSVSGNTVTITGTGLVTIEASQSGNINYNPATTVSRNFEVDKALLSVTADDQNIVYGDAIPTLTVSYSGFVNSEDENDLTTEPIASTTADGNSNAGDYPITVSGGVSDNYDFDYTAGNLNIAKANQTITFDPIPDKVYGDAGFTLSASSDSGLPVSFSVASGNASVSGNTVTINGTGTVIIEANQNGDGNYNPAIVVSRSFEVDKALLSVTADDKNIVYGDAIPTLTVSYSGFVNSEDENDLTTEPIASTTADGNSNAGDYPITVSGGVSDNYDFDYTAGNLNIAKADQTITFDPIPDKVYGDAGFTLSANSDSGLPISFSVASGNASVLGNTVTINGTGLVSIEASQSGNINYNPATTVSQGFEVSKALLTVTADDKNIVYGDGIPALTISYSGFVNSEDQNDLSTAPVANTTANASSDAGDYPISVSGGISENYDFDYTAGTLSIAKADQTITFNAISDKTYGDGDFTLSASSDSGLPVSFSVASGNASVSGNTVTIIGTGMVNIEASQSGNINYNSATVVSRSFEVDKALLSVTADDKNIVYGDAIPTLTVSYSGFVNSEDENDLTTEPIASTTADGNSNAGDYPITVSGGVSDNYDFDYTAGNLNIAKADQTITFDPIPDKVYGDAGFTLSANSDSGLPISFSVASGNASVLGNTVTINGTGLVSIEASQSGNINYNPATTVSQGFEVSKALLTVTADDKNIVYGDGIPALTISYSGFVNSEDQNDLSTAPVANTTANASSDAGDYPISVSGGISENYDFDYTAGTLSIAKADQTITFNAISDKTYGDGDFTLSASSDSGLPVSFSVASGNASVSGNTVTIIGTGMVNIEASQSGNINYNSATVVSRSFEVDKALLSVTADDKNIVYGDAIPTLTVSYSGFVNSEDENDLTTEPIASTTADGNSNAGDYPITVSGGVSDNYDFDYTAGNLNIAKADQTITFDPIPDKVYGDAGFTLSANSDSGLPISFSVASGNASVLGNTVTINGTGLVSIEASQSGNINYNPATTVSQGFEVSKALLTVTADDKNIVYGDGIPALTISYSGFVNSEDQNDLSTAPVANTTANASSDAGDYPISVSGGISENYDFDYTAGTLSIAKADQTITFNAISDKTYGDGDFTLSASSDSGLPVSFSVASGNASVSGNTVTIIGTGMVNIEASQSGNINYNSATVVSRSFEVDKALLSVTADDKNIVYGDAIPTLTVSYSGFVNSEDENDLTTEPIASTTADGNSNAGDYPITVSGGVSDNYDFDYTAGNLNIAKADQTITFDPIPDKVYGDAGFTLSANSDSGLPISFSVASGNASVLGNTVTINGTGLVSIEASQSGNINYNPATTVSQGFEVSKALLTVTADDKNIVYGDGIPALTISYSGFVNSEDQNDLSTAPVANTTANASSDAGDYPISVSGGISENYDFDYTAGTLSIAKADQTITFNAISDKTYGDGDFTLSASSDSGLPVSFSVASGNASVSGNTVTIIGTGMVNIEASQSGNINYNSATTVSRSFEVEKAVADIQINNTLQNFDGSPKEVTIVTQPENLNFNITYDGSTTPPFSAGVYTVEVTIVEDNYKGELTAELIINNAPTTTGIPNQEVAEDSNPIQLDLLNYFNDVEDEDSELTFSVTNNSKPALFSSIKLTDNIIELSFKPNANGVSTITIRCTDSNGLFVEDSFEMEVTPVQDPPFFTSEPITEVFQDEEYQYNITAEDYDKDDILTISNIISLPSWLTLTDNGDGSAILSGSTNNNLVGTYGIAIGVNDGEGNSANQFFDIEIIDVNDPPIFTSSPIIEAEVDKPYFYSISTQDIDQDDEVSIYAVKKPSWLSFSTESLPQGSATLEGTPTNNDRNSSQDVELIAVDLREDTVYQIFTINIDFPNTAPFFTSEPITEATQDIEYEYQIKVEDAEADSLKVTAINLPEWLEFSEESLILIGSPSNNEVGEHEVSLEVEDFFGLKTTQNFTIEVENVNDPPTIISTPDTIAVQNQLYEYRIETEDIDLNDNVEITIIKKPDWLNFDNENLLSGTPIFEDVEKSPFEVEINAMDIEGAKDTQSFNIHVQLENLPPTIDPINNPEAILEDSEEEFTINLTGISDGGENNQEISLGVSTDLPNLFEVLNIEYESPNSEAVLNYQIRPDSFGIAQIKIRVEDNGPSSISFTEISFQIEVTPVNDAPEITSTPVERTLPNEFYQYQITAIDADPNDELTFSLTNGPEWLSLINNGNQTATLQGEVPENATSEEISITVTDLQNASNTQSYLLKINDPPIVTNFDVKTDEDVPYQFVNSDFTENYSDPEGDNIDAIQIFFNRGRIQLNGSDISTGESINFEDDFNLQYIPPQDFFGNINLEWSASDGFVYSELANILVKIDTVNDKPILSNIENTTLEFIQGSDPISITETMTVSDIDDLTMDTAWVQITKNYNPSEDRLFLTGIDNSEIAFEFNQSSGLLLITGNAPKSDYDFILRSVTYQNINSLSDDISLKSISFSISDGEDRSEEILREVQLASVLPELDFVNAFTPNGDQVNDSWDFPNLEAFEQVNISVFNTQGVRVFHCTTNDCEWDGNFNQQELPAGTYFYLIKLNNGRRKYEGDVTILR
jgi:gliding motility-associated-like protein